MAVLHASNNDDAASLRIYYPLLIPIALLVRFLYYRYNSPLRKYPGPLLASGSRAWKVWSTWAGHTEVDHIRAHEKYGTTLLLELESSKRELTARRSHRPHCTE